MGKNLSKSGDSGGGKSDKNKNIKQVYTFKEKLGTGSFAVVKRVVRNSDKEEFAVKVIRKTKLNKDELAVVHDEVEIMQRVEHKHCVRLFEIYETSAKLYMVMELLTGGELFDRIVTKGNYSEKEAADVVNTVAEALKYLHDNGIVHRDLKPENLIYQNSTEEALLKITDFGLAKYRSTDTAHALLNTACGTPGYVAPEVLEGKQYGKEVDLWSLGVILYILLCGFPPFYDETTAGLYRQIKQGQYDFPDPYWTDITDDAKDVVRGLLTVKPKERWDPDALVTNSWVSATASPKKLPAVQIRNLRLHTAKKDLRKGVRAVIAINRFVRALVKEAEKARPSKTNQKIVDGKV